MSNPVTRRSLLAATVASLVLPAACTRSAPTTGGVSVASLTSESPFYIAHRGGDRNWPEMTAYAYAQAAALPYVHALEISVCITSDGVLVCSHDADTARVTGTDYTISDVPWSVLEPLTVTPKFTDNPGQPRRPFTRLADVLARYVADHVIFIEPKVAAAVPALQQALVALGRPERLGWKQPIDGCRFEWAKAQGFTTWGYILDQPSHSMDRVRSYAAGPTVDMLGIECTRPDDVIAEVA